jgi:hypothetical protein
MPPQKIPLESYRDVIIKNSRDHYGTPKAVVESRIASEWRSGASEAVAAKVEQQKEKRLSEALVPNFRAKTAPGMRDVRDVERRDFERRPAMAVRPPMRPAPVFREEKKGAAMEPEKSAPRADVPQVQKKILHPEVDIDALKRAISESLKKKDAGEEGK